MAGSSAKSRAIPVVAALMLPLAGFAAAGCGGSSARPETHPPPHDPASPTMRFPGVPQHGRGLGSPGAPYTLVEFADLQCPFCSRFDRDVLPAVIERFVTAGKLRIELRPIAFLGPDSARLGAAAVAAGFQDRMWQFADLVYRNQGRENSGYATPEFIGRIARAVRGLDLARLQRASGTRVLRAALEANVRSARTAGIVGTPGFRFGRTGGILAPFGQGPIGRRDFLHRLGAAIGANDSHASSSDAAGL